MPRRFAWLLAVVAAVFAFLAALRDSGAMTSGPRWFLDSAVCALALAVVAWSLPGQPPTVP